MFQFRNKIQKNVIVLKKKHKQTVVFSKLKSKNVQFKVKFKLTYLPFNGAFVFLLTSRYLKNASNR